MNRICRKRLSDFSSQLVTGEVIVVFRTLTQRRRYTAGCGLRAGLLMGMLKKRGALKNEGQGG